MPIKCVIWAMDVLAGGVGNFFRISHTFPSMLEIYEQIVDLCSWENEGLGLEKGLLCDHS